MNHHVKAKHKDEFCLRSLWFHNKFTTVLKIKVRAQDTRWMCPNISEVKVNQVRCDCLLCVSMICDWNIQSLSKAKYNSMVNTSSRHKVSSTKVENSPWTLWVKGKGVHCSPTPTPCSILKIVFIVIYQAQPHTLIAVHLAKYNLKLLARMTSTEPHVSHSKIQENKIALKWVNINDAI